MAENEEKLSFLEELFSTDDNPRPPPVLLTTPPPPQVPPTVSEVPTSASMIPKDVLTSTVPSISVQSQGPDGSSQVTPVTKGLYYTLTTINGVLDLSSPMTCPEQPHPTLASPATDSTHDTLPTATVTELVIPPANSSTTNTAAIPITVENSFIIPQTESLPVFEVKEGNLIASNSSSLPSSPASASCSTSSALNLGSSASITISASPMIQIVPADLSMTSEPAESQLTSPIPSTASSVISEVLEDEDLPPSLAKAVQTVNQTGSLTPLIKEELRYTIQNKRLLKGESELVVEPKKETQSKLSPEEEEKRARRRERNKLAAQKCRGKRRTQMESLEKETQKLESLNSSLRKQMKTLQVEKEKLTLLLRCHDTSLDMCPGNQKLSVSEDDPVVIPSLDSVASVSGSACNDVFMESSDTDSYSDDILSVGQEEDIEGMNMMIVDGEVVIE